MTEEPKQPEGADDELASQLDELLKAVPAEDSPDAQGDSQEAESAAPVQEAGDETDELDELIDRQVDEAIADAEELVQKNDEALAAQDEGDAAAEEDVDLAGQLQALLDEAADKEGQDEPLTMAAPAAELPPDSEDHANAALTEVASELESENETATEQEDMSWAGSFDAPDTVMQADESAGEESPQESVEEVAQESVAQTQEGVGDLDELLAESADEAIAGDFETIEQVASQEAEPIDDNAQAASADSQGTAEEKETPPEPVAMGASASDVAAELDEDVSPPPVAPVAAQAQPIEAGGLREKLSDMPPLLVTIERVARHICAIINKPIARLDTEWRNAIGYVGLLSMFTATAMILVGLLF